MSPKARATGVLAVVVFSCVGVSIIQAPLLRDTYALSRGSAATTARVISYDSGNHGLARYTYAVGHETYEGGQFGSSLRPGDEVIVHYALARPWVSITSAPDRAFRDALGGTAAILAFLVIGIPIGAYLQAGARFLALGLVAVGIVVIAQAPGLLWPLLVGILLAGLVVLILRARQRHSDNSMRHLGLR